MEPIGAGSERVLVLDLENALSRVIVNLNLKVGRCGRRAARAKRH
jgi:hypothetical protein